MPLTLLERFIDSYDASIQTRMQALVDAIKANHSFTDLEEFLTLSQNDVADDVAGLASSNGFITGFSGELISKTNSLISTCSPSDNIEERFYSMFGSGLSGGLADFVNTLTEKAVINNFKDLATASSTVISDELAGQTCNTQIVQDFSGNLLSDIGVFLNDVTRVVSFTAAISPENKDYQQVYVKCYDTDPDPDVLLGEKYTTHNGIFEITYSETIPEDGSEITRNLKFDVYTSADAATPYTSPTKIFDPATEKDFVINTINTPPLDDESPDVGDLANAPVSLTFPSGFLTYLSGKGVDTLQDVREKGGIYHFDDIPGGTPGSLITDIDNYASLTDLTTDLTKCKTLYNEGYKNIPTIASSVRSSFVTAVSEAGTNPIGSTEVASFYAKAVGIHQMQNSIIWSGAVSKQNGFTNPWLNQVSGSQTISSLLATDCNCDDCESGVSPLAYLSSLLKYSVDNVENLGADIDIAFLENNFYQPFGKLSSDCDEVENKVCQIRVCIDVLRKYYEANSGSMTSDALLLLRQNTKTYLIEVYNNILSKIGTSYEELDGIADEKKEAVANRLGIDETKLLLLKLDIVNADIDTNDSDLVAAENNLEKLFGLPSTVRNPLSKGYLENGSTDIVRWDITGEKWGYNTDDDGYIHGELKDVSGDYTINLYKSSTFGTDTIVATGKITTTSGIVNLTPLNNSCVFGNIEVDYSSDIFTLKFSMFSEYAAWKLQKVNEDWQKEDNLTDSIFTNTDKDNDTQAKKQKYPYLDPDIVSLDDLRDPTNTTTDSPSEIWVKRRTWIDDIITEAYDNQLFSGDTGPDVASVYAYLATNSFSYYSSPLASIWDISVDPANFESWYKILTNPSDSAYDTTKTTVKTDLLLEVDEFIRMYELEVILDALGTSNSEYSLTAEQRAEAKEFIDITIVACKRKYQAAWIAEEQTKNIWLNQGIFYKALTEPEVGTWPTINQPYISQSGLNISVPLIEPGVFSLANMVDEKLLYHLYQTNAPGPNSVVYDVYNYRKGLLTTDLSEIREFRKVKDTNPPAPDPGDSILTYGFEQLLQSLNTSSVIGDAELFKYSTTAIYTNLTLPGASYQKKFLALIDLIEDEEVQPINNMQGYLYMSVDEFKELADYYLICLEQGLSDAQWENVYALMQTGLKRAYYYTDWNTIESNWESVPTVTLKYWEVQKQKLVKWRANEDIRKQWGEYLERSTELPAIDPDYVFYSNFINPIDDDGNGNAYTNLPFKTWGNRKTTVAGWRGALSDNIDTYLTYIGDVYENYTPQNLYDDYVNNGKDIGPYVAQLNLTISQLEILCKLDTDYPVGPITAYSDIEIAQDIMLTVYKRRNTALENWAGWHRQEAIEGLYISPKIFALPIDTSLSFNLAVQDSNTRLVNPATKLEWQQKLTARIDEQNFIIQGQNDLIDVVKDEDQIQLRDALVTSLNKFGYDTVKNAEWVHDNLLIDAQTNCCSPTTRIAQALETLQVFLFGLRHGQLANDYPDLTLDNDYFDEHWRWLGTYSNWRSLMFSYLYPENLLDPTFRDYQTGKFREITDAIVGNSRFNPKFAEEAAQQYKAYFKDVTNLELKASVSANVIDNASGRFRSYNISRSTETGNIYWNSYDLISADGDIENVTTWEPIPGFRDTKHIAGATAFTVKSGTPYIYVLATLNADKLNVIRFNRYNLTELTWDTEATELEVDKRYDTSTAVLETIFKEGQVPFVGMKWNKDEPDQERLYTFQFSKEGKGFTDEVRAIAIWLGDVHSLIRVQSDNSVNGDQEYVYCMANIKRSAVTIQSAKLLTGFFKANPTKSENREQWYASQGITPINTLSDVEDNYIGGIYQYKSTVVNRIHSYFKSKKGTFYLLHDLSFNTAGEPTVTTITEDIAESSKLDYIGPVSPVELDATNSIYSISAMGMTAGKSLIVKGTIKLIITPELNQERFSLSYLAPIEQTGLELKQKNTPDELQQRRFYTNENLNANSDTHYSQRVYLVEYYYYMPMLLAIQLQKNRFYTEALDWYKVVFDYSADINNRKIYYGLILEENILTGNILSGSVNTWLTSPTDPHIIAATRPNNFTRFTVNSIVQCLMDFGDSEYTRDTTESVPRARTLYDLALELLNEQVFNQQTITCDELINGLDYLITDVTVWDTWLRIKNMLRDADTYEAVYNLMDPTNGSIKPVLIDDGTTYPDWEAKIERILYLVQEELKKNTAAKTTDGVLTLSNINALKAHLAVYAVPNSKKTISTSGTQSQQSFTKALSLLTGSPIANAISDNPDEAVFKSPFNMNGSPTVLNFIPSLDNNAYEKSLAYWKSNPAASMLLNQSIKTAYLPVFTNYYCVVPNPIPDYMRMHAEIQLLKIRNCLSISGLKRELDPYAAPIDATSGIPSLIGGGRLNTTAGVPRSATIYRYQFLVERTKQLVSYAQQMESSLLSALEKRDAEYYTVMKAKQDLSISKANVKLGDLRLNEAESGVVLAQYQLERSETQVSSLQGLIDKGLTKSEKTTLEFYILSRDFQINISNSRALANSFSAIANAATALTPNVPYALAAALVTSGSYANIANLESSLIRYQAEIQKLSIYAAHERRVQEWSYQKTLAQKDVKIANQQIRVAENRVKVVGQEKQIAEMQSGFAEDTLNFLSSKFTNVQLYEWMVRILQRSYDRMLQEATSMAKLAQLQLAFERQEGSSGIIQDDYWEAPADASGNTGPDRRGLTGSTRLLGDIVKLESYAIETNQRKLQLTKTISLATYFPIEFQQFRETGQFSFQTTLEHFNRDFPGHYLRLIKSVRTSVIALTPPNEGIKATLANTGNSTVVVKANSTFPEVKVSKLPESVALTSPYNASGLFDLQQQDPTMYLPFEGSGVETMWFFEMLKANNPFDFNTIADVILTIEYTALEDYNYKVRRMNGNNATNADGSRLFSMRNDFADQWYDLSNGVTTVEFDTSKFNFPVNTIISNSGNSVNLYISYNTDKEKPSNTKVEVAKLELTGDGGKATGENLVIDPTSTKLPMLISPILITGLPYGKWEMTLGENGRKLIEDEYIDDILFIINYKANTAAYPKLA